MIRFFKKHNPNCETAVPCYVSWLYYQVSLRAINNAATSQSSGLENPAGALATTNNNNGYLTFLYLNNNNVLDTGTVTLASGSNGSLNPVLYS